MCLHETDRNALARGGLGHRPCKCSCLCPTDAEGNDASDRCGETRVHPICHGGTSRCKPNPTSHPPTHRHPLPSSASSRASHKPTVESGSVKRNVESWCGACAGARRARSAAPGATTAAGAPPHRQSSVAAEVQMSAERNLKKRSRDLEDVHALWHERARHAQRLHDAPDLGRIRPPARASWPAQPRSTRACFMKTGCCPWRSWPILLIMREEGMSLRRFPAPSNASSCGSCDQPAAAASGSLDLKEATDAVPTGQEVIIGRALLLELGRNTAREPSGMGTRVDAPWRTRCAGATRTKRSLRCLWLQLACLRTPSRTEECGHRAHTARQIVCSPACVVANASRTRKPSRRKRSISAAPSAPSGLCTCATLVVVSERQGSGRRLASRAVAAVRRRSAIGPLCTRRRSQSLRGDHTCRWSSARAHARRSRLGRSGPRVN